MTSSNDKDRPRPRVKALAREQGMAFSPPPTHRPRRYSESRNAAACLARVLARHGLAVDPAEIESRLTASPLTGDVLNFLEVAEHYGLQGMPRVLTCGEWPGIPHGSILHWGQDRLVVCETVYGDGYDVFDPVLGNRRVALSEFRRHFTGVVLEFLRATEATDPHQATRSRKETP